VCQIKKHQNGDNMKILVIEDKEMHRKSAQETLTGHDVTIVSSFDEGMNAMDRGIDYDLKKRLESEAGHGGYPHDTTDAKKAAWQKRDDELSERARRRPDFEAVLVDMMMPMSRDGAASGKYQRGVEVPYGFVLVLVATQMGAKYIAMVTDTNHHHSAISASLDFLGSAYYHGTEKPLEINGAKCLYLHAPFVEDIIKDAPCEDCHETGVCSVCNGTGTNKHFHKPCHMCKKDVGKCSYCKGSKKTDKKVHERKDWGRVLRHLVTGSGKEIRPEDGATKAVTFN
jgi:CheY-like chemotaxis protein